MRPTGFAGVSLDAPVAPVADEHQDYVIWPSYDPNAVMQLWVEVGVVPQDLLYGRLADPRSGKWLSEIMHICLPDCSCCHPELLASDEDRNLWRSATAAGDVNTVKALYDKFTDRANAVSLRRRLDTILAKGRIPNAVRVG